MLKQFYTKCIIRDRKLRKFLDFSEEEWYKNFLKIIETVKKCENCVDLYFRTVVDNAEFFDNNEIRKKFSYSQVILDYFVCNECFLSYFLDMYKKFYIGNANQREIEEYDKSDKIWADLYVSYEKHDKKEFIKFNLPIIRMMDYFLEKRAFKCFSLAMEKLEHRFIDLFFEITSEEIDKIVMENIECKDIIYIFSQMNSYEFEKYFKDEYVCIFKEGDIGAIIKLLEASAIPEKYIKNEFFIDTFKKIGIMKQINILELLEDNEYDTYLIEGLRKLLNKVESSNEKILLDGSSIEDEKNYRAWQNKKLTIIGMSNVKLEKIKNIIENSSYFKKYNVKNTDLWKIISLDKDYEVELTHSYYEDIISLYNKCREYATSSIVESLYPLNQVSSGVVHLYEGHYNILARVRTLWEKKDLADTFKFRTFCSYSILTEKNMSHYGNSVLYGYYTNVTSDLIAHIFPIDSLSNSGAKTEKELTKRVNMLLDIDDLNETTLKSKTYNQLCIRTKTKDGKILWPDCIVCIDKVDECSKQVADNLKLGILVLHKNSDTIEENEDIYKDLQ